MSQARIPRDFCSVNAKKGHITRLLRWHDIDYNISLSVLWTALSSKELVSRNCWKFGKKKKEIWVPSTRQTICKKFYISSARCSKIHLECSAHGKFYIIGKRNTGMTCNLMVKATRIPSTNTLWSEFRILFSAAAWGKRIASCQIFNFLLQNNPTDETGKFICKHFNSPYCGVHW